MTEDLWRNELLIDWLKGELLYLVLELYIQSLPSEFTHRCVSRLQEIGDEASSFQKHEEALSAYSTVLLLTPSPPEDVLMGWARIVLIRRSASEALDTVEMVWFIWSLRIA
jgi:hypothetical protein